MSFRDCMQTALAAGAISKTQHEQMSKLLDYHEKVLRGQGMGEAEARAGAAQKVQEQSMGELTGKKLATVQAFKKYQKSIEDLDKYRQLTLKGGKPNAARGMAALVEDDPHGMVPFLSAKSIAKNNLRKYTNMMQPFINRFGAGLYSGVKHIKELDDVEKELYGQDSGNKLAKQSAESIMQAREAMRLDANSLGANIGKHELYGSHMIYNSVRVSELGQARFVKDVMEHINPETTVDYHGTPFKALPDKGQDFAEHAWGNIKTQGFLKAQHGAAPLIDRMSMQRWFHWKDAASAKYMRETYGDGSMFDSVMHDTDRMSHSIAMLDRFGPNPRATWNYLKEGVLAGAAKEDKENIDPSTRSFLTRARKEMHTSDQIFDQFSGQDSPFRNDKFFHTLQGVNNLLAAALVAPKVVLKELPTDIARGIQMRYIAKMPIAGFIGKWAKGMIDEDMAKRLGILNESALGHRLAQQRYMGDVMGGWTPDAVKSVLKPGWTGRVYDFMSRKTAFNAAIQSGRSSHQWSMMAQLADDAGKSFSDLKYKASLERAGFTAKEWDAIRATEKYDVNGAKFLRPDDIKDNDLAQKLMIHVMDESQRAIPDASLRVRSAWLGNATPGTWPYAIAHSILMWKNFPLTLYHQWLRGLMLQEGTASRLRYAAVTQTAYLMAGAVGVQLYQLAEGKNPINMNPVTKNGQHFWEDAAVKGGGLSLLGDTIANMGYQGGKGATSMFEPPVVRTLGDVWDATGGQAMKAIDGKPTDMAPAMLNLAGKYAPVPWYATALVKNHMLGIAQRQIDPKFDQKQREVTTHMQNRFGQKYFIPPGGTATAPDLSQAFKSQ